MKIAIIGAGLSSCNLYKNLNKEKFQITIFEKARGTGGRLSTKYIGDQFIDHGTPYINTNNSALSKFLDDKSNENILSKINNNYYPTNGINKLCSSLINKEDLVKNTRIIKTKFINNSWTLFDENNKTYEGFDFIVYTIPATQILENDFDLEEQTKEDLKNVTYDAMATLICHREKKCTFSFSEFEKNDMFFKVINNSSKYKYEEFKSYVFHLNKDFVQENISLCKDEIFKLVHKKIKQKFNLDLKDDFVVIEHLWKYAFVKDFIKKDFIINENKAYAICGDYFNAVNLEAAYKSSKETADEINSIYKKDKKC